jgi:hypothetical protein
VFESLALVQGFRAISPICRSQLVNNHKANLAPSSTRLHSFNDVATTLIAVGDYAAEIEKAVGEEIYSPIFKSGLVLFGSGLISAFIAAFIVSKSDSWAELGDEFERGKIKQLIELDGPGEAGVSGSASISNAPAPTSSAPAAPVAAATATAAVEKSNSDMKGFDL